MHFPVENVLHVGGFGIDQAASHLVGAQPAGSTPRLYLTRSTIVGKIILDHVHEDGIRIHQAGFVGSYWMVIQLAKNL